MMKTSAVLQMNVSCCTVHFVVVFIRLKLQDVNTSIWNTSLVSIFRRCLFCVNVNGTYALFVGLLFTTLKGLSSFAGFLS